VKVIPGSLAHRVYGTSEATEVFACNYGLNEAFTDQVGSRDLRISGYDEDGTVRMVELPNHPFFIATLFVPQIISKPGKPHPLIRAFVESSFAQQQDRASGIY